MLSIGLGSSTSVINAPAVSMNVPDEKPDALSNDNGNGNGAKGEKVVKGTPKATRVVGSFDHPLLPMTPVSVATHARGSDCSRARRNGRSSRPSIS